MQLTNPAVHTYTIRNNTNTILYEFVKPIWRRCLSVACPP
jgi:hypothetical protein